MATFTGSTGDDIANATSGTLTGFTGGDLAALQDTTGDTFNAGAGADSIVAGSGNDTLNGGDGNDTLAGGLGNDSLNGNAGNDTYVFSSGDGTDTVYAYDTETVRNETLQFTDVASNNPAVQLAADGSDLILKYGATDQVSVTSFFSGANYKITHVKFTDTATALTSDQLLENYVLNGGANADTINLGAGNNTVDSGAGNDNVHSGDGNDQVSGGANDDYLYGGNGDDTLDGGDGIDRIYGEADNDSLSGGLGTDTLYGGSENDTITGGQGNDYLQGDTGNDTYVFATGDGVDNVYAYDNDTVHKETLQFTDVTSIDSSFQLSGDGSDLILKYGTGDEVHIQSFFYGGGYRITDFKFSDSATALTADQLLANYALNTGANADTINLGAGNNTVDSGAGNDTVHAGDGNDQISGAANDDYLYGGNGDDTLDGGDGIDRLYGEADNDSLSGGLGTDTLYGGSENDTLNGGKGNDYLQGDAGNDTYVFAIGDGIDLVSANDNDTVHKETLQFSDVASSDASFGLSGDGYDLILKYGTSDEVHIQNFFYGANYRVTDFKFSDTATALTADQLLAAYALNLGANADTVTLGAGNNTVSGGAGNDNIHGGDGDDQLNGGANDDYLYGGNGNDTIDGGDHVDHVYGEAGDDSLSGGLGADTLEGGEGNDTLDGGGGNDTLYGNAGTNTYKFSAGFGSDTLYSNTGSSTIANTDVVIFTDIKSTDVTSDVKGGPNNWDRIITIGTDVLTLKDYYYTTSTTQWTVKEIRYSDSPVNHAPAGADATVATAQNSPYALKIADFGFSDSLDTPANTLLAVKIATLPAAGTLLLNGTPVSVGQFVAATDIASGKLTFAPAADATGSPYANFTFQVQDNGGTGNGGVDLDPTANTVTVNVTAPVSVNQAPAGTDKTVTTIPDTAYTLSQADFGFTDGQDGDQLLAVKITGLPGAGNLLLDGSPVTAGQSVTVADISAGLLSFAPAAGASGYPYAGFTFQVQDDGGTANGGADLDPSPNVLTVNVGTPEVNHAPSGTDKAISTEEDTPRTLSVADFGFSDGQDGYSLKAVKVATLPAYGNLQLDGASVVAGQFVPATDIAAGKLRFVPVANANGMPYASFTFQVQDNGGTANGGVDLDPTPNTLSLDVTPANDAPIVAQPLSGHTEKAGQSFSYQVPAATFADPDQGDTLTYRATLADGSALPSWLQFDPATRTFTGTAPTTAGTLAIELTATDSAMLAVTEEFSWVTSAGTVGGEPSEGDDLLAGQAGQSDRFDGLGGDDAAVINDKRDSFSDSGPASDFDVAVVTLPIDYRLGRGVEGLVYAGITGSDDDPVKASGDNKANVMGVYGDALLDALFGKGVDLFPLFDENGPVPSPAVDPGLRFYLDGKGGDDWLFGGDGDDTYVLLGADASLEFIEDSGGNDTVVVDTAIGGAAVELPDGFENLVIKGRANVDGSGNSLDNTLAGNGGVNHLIGDAGNDTLIGGNSGSKGKDVLEGGDGSDTYVVYGKNYEIVETAAFGDIDTVRSSKINIDLSQLGEGGANIEQIMLENGRSLKATGNDAGNAILGNAGRNPLDGKGGADLLFGGAGNDKLTGGDGADLFLFDGSKGYDLVTDFTSGTDALGLDGERFAVLDGDGDGRVDAAFFVSGAGAKPQEADDYLIYDSRSGILWFDADGSGGGKASKLAVLSGTPELSAGDIQVTNVGVAELAEQWLAQPLDTVA